jgi:DNA topoisomerase-1
LKDRHVEISGTRLRFCFRGKSGQVHDVELTDRRLAGIVRQCRDLPGYELFQYVDESGQPSRVDSEDVNLYLRGITGQGFSAKDFRTWAGTILAARALLAYGECRFREVKQRIAGAVKTVATQLGNRPATCRKYYVHPAVLDAYEEGVLVPAMNHDINVSSTGLRREELCVLALIQQHIERESQLLKKSA